MQDQLKLKKFEQDKVFKYSRNIMDFGLFENMVDREDIIS